MRTVTRPSPANLLVEIEVFYHTGCCCDGNKVAESLEEDLSLLTEVIIDTYSLKTDMMKGVQ